MLEKQAGAIYMTAPNEGVYALIASGPPEQWEEVAGAIQMLAESIVFDEELISLTSNTDDPALYTEGEGWLELEIPAGWYILDSDNPVYQVVLSEAEVRFAMAVAAGEDFDEALTSAVLEQIVPLSGELSPEEQGALIADIVNILVNAGGDVELDAEMASITSREGGVTVRVPGIADLKSGVIIPVAFYVDLRTTGSVVVAVFGDLDAASGIEAEIQALVESVTGL
jgi:hypothetical protein